MLDRTSKYLTCLLASAALVSLGACGGDAAPGGDEMVVETLTPRDRLHSAAATLSAAESFHFTLRLENRTIPLDALGMLTYSDVQGSVVAPDRMQAETLVRTPLGNTQVALIAIGDQKWITNPLTRQWESAPPEAGGGVSGMFNPETGIGAMLVNMDDPQLADEQPHGGAPAYRLSGRLPGSVLAAFAQDLLAVEQLDVLLVVTALDDRIRQIVVREPAGANGPAPVWTFDLTDFDQPVSIEPPPS